MQTHYHHWSRWEALSQRKTMFLTSQSVVALGTQCRAPDPASHALWHLHHPAVALGMIRPKLSICGKAVGIPTTRKAKKAGTGAGHSGLRCSCRVTPKTQSHQAQLARVTRLHTWGRCSFHRRVETPVETHVMTRRRGPPVSAIGAGSQSRVTSPLVTVGTKCQ